MSASRTQGSVGVGDGFQTLRAALYPTSMAFHYHFQIFFWTSFLIVMLARKQFEFFFSTCERSHSAWLMKPTVMCFNTARVSWC